MYAYPIDINQYNKNKDAKIDDIVALVNETILVIRQGKNKNGSMNNKIYKVNLIIQVSYLILIRKDLLNFMI